MADRINPFAPQFQDDLAAEYKRSGSVRPYTRADVAKAIKPYNLGSSSKRAGKNDVQLEQIAAAAVVAKFRKNQQATAQAKAVSPRPAPAPVAAAPRSTTVRAPAPAPLTAAQVTARLKAFGVPLYWNPPANQRTSQAVLDAWIRRAIAYQQAHAPRPPATPAPVSSPAKQATAPAPIATNRAPVPL